MLCNLFHKSPGIVVKGLITQDSDEEEDTFAHQQLFREIECAQRTGGAWSQYLDTLEDRVQNRGRRIFDSTDVIPDEPIKLLAPSDTLFEIPCLVISTYCFGCN